MKLLKSMKYTPPDTCPSCEALPARIHGLQFSKPYQSHVTGHWVEPMLDDFRCRWCGAQWNERERLSGWMPRVGKVA